MDKRYNLDRILPHRKCPICGRKFVVLDKKEYAYKRGYKNQHKFFCSWGCMRKYDAKHPPSKKIDMEF